MPKYLLIMREKFKILQEDDTKIYNKWVKGIAKQEAPSQVITVDDIINRYRNSLSYEAPKNLPFGLNFLLNQVGDIFSKSSLIRKDLELSMRNPVIFEHNHRVKAVNNINEKLAKIQDILFSITEDMNMIVENDEK
jgi:hypothetical protein